MKAQILENTIKEVTIQSHSNSAFEEKNKTSSSNYVSPEDLKKYDFSDINRILKAVTGVNMYEEDGYGLRPNISLRGVSGERSSKITLMEDGILIAPAPYTASSAYYFPSIYRMSAIEILKGNCQIQYGPQTTGGAINMISVPIPDSSLFTGLLSYGSFNTKKAVLSYGNSYKNFGYVAQYADYSSNGFKTIAGNPKINTGFNKQDAVVKMRFNTDKSKSYQHIVDMKFQYSHENSNETYLGLTENDFNSKDRYERYSGSANDNMKTNHYQGVITYTYIKAPKFSIVTSAYANYFKRNWYKINDVSIDGKSQSISSILSQSSSLSPYFNLLNGSTNSDSDDYLNVRANNRGYLSTGLQSVATYYLNKGDYFHKFEGGLRFHYDYEDRFQWDDHYATYVQKLFLTQAGRPGTQTNRFTDSKALATYFRYHLEYKKLTINAGLRNELIDAHRLDYDKTDTLREQSPKKDIENFYTAFMPSFGMNYKFSDIYVLYGGIHRGFSPANVVEDQKAEKSWNFELGNQFFFPNGRAELVGFYVDYANLLGTNSNASGNNSGDIEQYNAGKVQNYGLEASIQYNIIASNKVSIPLNAGYTFTQAKFRTTFESENELWGNVVQGDELPYLAHHQVYFNAGFNVQKFSLNILNKYQSAMRAIASQGELVPDNTIPQSFVMDASAFYTVNRYFTLGLKLLNITDNQNSVSQVPAGLRPMMPRSVQAEVRFGF